MAAKRALVGLILARIAVVVVGEELLGDLHVDASLGLCIFFSQVMRRALGELERLLGSKSSVSFLISFGSRAKLELMK